MIIIKHALPEGNGYDHINEKIITLDSGINFELSPDEIFKRVRDIIRERINNQKNWKFII